MKNIPVIDRVENCVCDIFAATDEEFPVIFPAGQDIAFIDKVLPRAKGRKWAKLDRKFTSIWVRKNR